MAMRNNRRHFLITGTAALVGAMLGTPGRADGAQARFEIRRSEAEWKKRLSARQFYILREEGTERRFSSRLLHEKRTGVYACAGCALPVYRSRDKFDSGTGWPSFTRAISGNVGTRSDRSWFMIRTEVHCRRCGGHLGHVFDDGPPPTGKRHCINGDALLFEPTVPRVDKS